MSVEGEIVGIKKDIKYIVESVKRMEKRMADDLVPRQEFMALKRRVDSHESNIVWVIRLIIGTIIVGILAVIGFKR